MSYVGMEYNMRLGRLSIAPSVAVGVGTMVPILGDETFRENFEFMASFGGTAKLSVNYLLNRDMMLNLNAGYSMYIGLFDDISYNTDSGIEILTNPADVQGSFIGAGITFKL